MKVTCFYSAGALGKNSQLEAVSTCSSKEYVFCGKAAVR